MGNPLYTILIWLAVGAIAGFLADVVIKGINLRLFGKIIVGIIGGFVGGWIFDLLGINLFSGFLGDVAAAFVGAVIVLLILRLIRRKR